MPPDQDERNDTDENLAVMFRLLIRHKSVKLEHLILNWRSFAQTVENIFALSFLVKDGRAEINVVDNGDHFVGKRLFLMIHSAHQYEYCKMLINSWFYILTIAPRNAPTAGLIASRKVTNNQFVFRFDTKDWEVTFWVTKLDLPSLLVIRYLPSI